MTRNSVVVLSLIASTVAINCQASKGVPTKKINPQEVIERVRAKQGGFFERPDSYKGKIVFINTQSKIAESEISKTISTICKREKLNIYLEKQEAGNPNDLLKRSGAQLALIIGASKDSPALLVAPEERWAVINVEKLGTAAVVRREILRGFSLLCGGGGVSSGASLMNAAKLEDLDEYEESIPTELAIIHRDYLKQLGVTPRMFAPYRKAVEEGWAPAPTNDIQKAIWNQVHALPSDPIKIKYDPKRDK